MTDDLPRYRSTKSVPDRVDRAWYMGYEAGRAESRKLAGLALIVAAYEVLRRHRMPLPTAVLIAAIVAVYVIPVVLVVLVIRSVLRRRREAKERALLSPVLTLVTEDDLVTLDDGSVF